MKTVIKLVLLLMLSESKLFATTISILAEDDWAPYANNDGTGMANEIIKEAFKMVGIEVKFDVMPYARILSKLKQGTYIAGFNVPFDKDSNNQYILGESPLFLAKSLYYQNRDVPIPFDKKEDIKGGLTVGVVRGYGYGDHFLSLKQDRLIEPVVANSDLSLIRMLFHRRVNSILIFDKVAHLWLGKLKLQSRITVAFSNEQLPIHLAFSKSHPEGLRYSELFQKGLLALKKTPRYKSIINSY